MLQPQETLFPPDTQVDSALEPYLRYFDEFIVADCLREKEEEFLKWAGVRDFNWDLLVDYLIRTEYGKGNPTPEENRRHLQILKKLNEMGRIAPAKLQELGQKSILRDRAGIYVQPVKA